MNTLSSLLKFIANSIAPIISNQTAKKVLAAPNGATGKPSFRELQASDITSGTLADARIPNLDASKVNSGTFTANRIPELDASKITSGVFPQARIPNLDISKVPDALDKSNLTFHTWTLDNQTMSEDFDVFTISAELSGYTLAGVIGVSFANATNGGVGSTGIVLRGFAFNQSGNTITVYARKVAGSTAKIRVIATGLYKK